MCVKPVEADLQLMAPQVKDWGRQFRPTGYMHLKPLEAGLKLLSHEPHQHRPVLGIFV